MFTTEDLIVSELLATFSKAFGLALQTFSLDICGELQQELHSFGLEFSFVSFPYAIHLSVSYISSLKGKC